MFCLVGIVSGLSVMSSQHNDVAVGVSVFIDENFARVLISSMHPLSLAGAEVINTDEKCF
jgi:hypothetical protein